MTDNTQDTSTFIRFSESHLHHVFCNFPNRPIKGCSCNKMKEKYGDMSEDEIMAKHFPDAKKRA